MDDVTKSLQILRGLIVFLIIAFIGVHIVYWLDIKSVQSIVSFHGIIEKFGGKEQLSTTQTILAAIVSSLSSIFLCWALLLIYKLTTLIRAQKWFDVSIELLCKKLGKVLITYTLLSIISETLLVLVLTMERAEGSRVFALGISTSQIVVLVPGFLAIIAAQIIKAGRMQHEELQQII